MDIGTLHRRLELTAEQTAGVHDVICRVEALKDSGNIGSDPDTAAVDSVTSVLRQQFEVVNRLLPSGESGVSQVAKSIDPSIVNEDAIDEECQRFLVPGKSTSFSYCVQVHAACNKFGQKHTVPTITWATDDFSALRLQNGSILTITALKQFIYEQYTIAEETIGDLCLGLQMPVHFARDLKDVCSINKPGYSFLTESSNDLPRQYPWDKMLSTPSLRSQFTTAVGGLLAGALYKQCLFSGVKGRFGAERLRKVIEHRTAQSAALHTALNAQGLRQALIAFLDQYAGLAKAVGVFDDDYAQDVQSGHSSQMAVSHYAISDQILPSTNRYDVHAFMLVSEAWFRFLGEDSPMQGLKRSLDTALPSQIGQSVDRDIPAVREVGPKTVEKTIVVREVTEIYPEAVDAKLLPGRSIQTIISNPGYSYLVVLPTGAALRYDIVDRVENLDGGHFRHIFSELLFKNGGHSLIARVIFDKAHAILGHWDFRPSFQAIAHITCFTIPIVLLSATVPPNRPNDIRRVYSRLDLRVIRAPTTTRPNIAYEVRQVPTDALRDTLQQLIARFFDTCQTADRSLVFCMSKAMVKSLYDEFSVMYENICFFHGDLTVDVKADILNKWMTGTYRLVFTTSGFGVGIHYDNVPMVIHYEGIWSLVDFVQESGRAGRNNKPAKSIVLLRNKWHPNYQKLSDGDAQVIDDFISPNGFCRRYDIPFEWKLC
ncbi:P-loop containing nucleoside triphosphate hydrolase protein [Lipomyces doorenjongii]|uniref:P-loop containing nucleoside triphosphate hydrolase protein n=1 Tax=Lipomyces doorenjongii TaxID=383834 RepID=UPI0034CF9983